MSLTGIVLGQEVRKELLIGTWELVEKNPGESNFESLITGAENSDEKLEFLLMFEINGKVTESNVGEIVNGNFRTGNGNLVMFENEYKILKLNKSELIIKEVRDFLPGTYVYKKTKKRVKSKS